MRALLSSSKKSVISLLNCLPLNSSLAGTPRHCVGLKDYLGRHPDVEVVKFKAQEAIEHELPVLNDTKFLAPYRNVATRNSPEQQVAVLPGGRVWGRNGAVVSKDDYFISDVSREFGVRDNCKGHSVFHNLSLGKAEYIDGNVAVLTTAGANVYYHWLLDVMPRYLMLKEAGLAEKIDYVVLDFNSSKFQKETLGIVGIKEEQIINCTGKRNFHVSARQLYVPTLLSQLSEVNVFECELLKKHFLNRAQSPVGKRIYISRRGGTRELVNEEEVVAYLRQHGFEVVMPEQYSVAEQAAMFNNAEIIAGPHGSAYANVVFCKPGTKLLDILPDSNIIPCFYSIAKNVGAIYYGFIDESVPVNNSVKNDSVKVDINLFRSFVDRHVFNN